VSDSKRPHVVVPTGISRKVICLICCKTFAACLKSVFVAFLDSLVVFRFICKSGAHLVFCGICQLVSSVPSACK